MRLPAEEVSLLKDAFERFHQVGERLEVKYAELKLEAEQLRATIAKKEEEIAKSERMAMLGQTAAAVAHEVRNPLGAMKLFVTMLKRHVGDESKKIVEAIEASIDSIDSVVTNILVFSKDRPMVRGPVDLASLCKERAEFFSSVHPVKIDIETPKSLRIIGNEEALRRAISNLIINSVQAGAKEVKIELTEDGVLTIRDSGPGFIADNLESLLEPFVTSKPSGTGLGLAIVNKTIQEHDGKIELRNNNGAEVIIQFPVKETI
jgi:signal transduction histidine kinase